MLLGKFDQLHHVWENVMISLILPIGGTCPYFLRTNLANIAETCGMNFTEFDMVLLTGKTIQPQLKNAIDRESEKYKFRLVQCPLESELHLDLIDWATTNVEFDEWMFFQHMDTFWKINQKPWLKETVKIIKENPNDLVIAHCDQWKNYCLNGKKVSALHDHCIAYNKKVFVDYKVKLNWGMIDNLQLSDKVRTSIKDKILTRECGKQINFTDWCDGSDVATMEAAVHFSDKIRRYNYHDYLIHGYGMIRPILTMQRNKKSLIMKYDFTNFLDHKWLVMSLISSCHFDLSESEQHIIPWKFISSATNCKKDKVENTEMFKIMSRYENPKNVLGIDCDMGIKQMIFENKQKLDLVKHL